MALASRACLTGAGVGVLAFCPARAPPPTQAVIASRCCSGVHPGTSALWVTGAAKVAPSPSPPSVTHSLLPAPPFSLIAPPSSLSFCLSLLYFSWLRSNLPNLCSLRGRGGGGTGMPLECGDTHTRTDGELYSQV